MFNSRVLLLSPRSPLQRECGQYNTCVTQPGAEGSDACWGTGQGPSAARRSRHQPSHTVLRKTNPDSVGADGGQSAEAAPCQLMTFAYCFVAIFLCSSRVVRLVIQKL